MPMEFINQNILLISIIVISAGGLIAPVFLRSGGKAINPGEATLLINRQDALVVDVRDSGEFAAGHLPDARNIPLANLAERVAEIEKYKDKPVILCCATGMRSGKACSELGKLGFTAVHNLAGGVDAWVGAGYPIKKGVRK